MIEEVGIVGLILFLLPVIKMVYLFFSSYRKSVIINRLQLRINLSYITHHSSPSFFHFSVLPFAFLLSILFHSQFEAWWVGVASFQYLIFIGILVMGEQ